MNVNEFAATIDQLRREREALNGAYADLQEEATARAKQAEISGKRPIEEAVPALIELTMKLGNFVNMEREHADKLYMLLLEMMGELAEAYELDLPPGWPDAGAP